MIDLKKIFYIVWVPKNPTPPMKQHVDYETARAEAERLALQQPSKGDVFVLKAVSRTRLVHSETQALEEYTNKELNDLKEDDDD